MFVAAVEDESRQIPSRLLAERVARARRGRGAGGLAVAADVAAAVPALPQQHAAAERRAVSLASARRRGSHGALRQGAERRRGRDAGFAAGRGGRRCTPSPTRSPERWRAPRSRTTPRRPSVAPARRRGTSSRRRCAPARCCSRRRCRARCRATCASTSSPRVVPRRPTPRRRSPRRSRCPTRSTTRSRRQLDVILGGI